MKQLDDGFHDFDFDTDFGDFSFHDKREQNKDFSSIWKKSSSIPSYILFIILVAVLIILSVLIGSLDEWYPDIFGLCFI